MLLLSWVNIRPVGLSWCCVFIEAQVRQFEDKQWHLLLVSINY